LVDDIDQLEEDRLNESPATLEDAFLDQRLPLGNRDEFSLSIGRCVSRIMLHPYADRSGIHFGAYLTTTCHHYTDYTNAG
jgi:hypothetical protein